MLFRDAYYECIGENVAYDEYVADFYAGQFVETAAYYAPSVWRSPISSEKEKKYAITIRQRLIEIADKITATVG